MNPFKRGIADKIAANRVIVQARWFYGLGIFILGLVSRSDQVTNVNFPVWLMAVYLVGFFTYNGGVWMAIRWVEQTKQYQYINFVAAFQLAVELFFMASIMHTAGGVESVSTTFFFIPIISSIVFFNAVAPLIIAAASGLIVNGIVLVEYYGIIEHVNRYFFSAEFGIHKILSLSLTRTITISIAYLIVGFLVAYITTIIRRREELLIESNEAREEQLERVKELNKELDETAKILVRRDRELSDANARLRELDQAKSEFVSVAAHQLRTPMTGVRWSFKAILEEEEAGTLTEDQKELLHDGLQATVNAINLINDLLNVARIEEGRFNYSFEEQEIVPFVQDRIQRHETVIEEKGLILETSFPETKCTVSFDESRLGMAVDNLLENAIKYTKPGGTITVSVEAQDGKMYLQIRDTGIGIPEEQQDKMFSKFFRGRNARLFQTEGTGLGLYMTQQIVESHQGSISFESAEGEGTTFTITLPLIEPAEE